MKATSRRVFIYNVDVDAHRKGAKLPTMAELAEVFARQKAAGKATILIDKGAVTVTIGDVSIDATSKVVTILVRHSDKASAETVTSDIAANVFRPNAKAASEGGETGCHVLISLAPEKNVAHRYTCVIEKVPNIDRGIIRRLLNRVIYAEYTNNPNAFEYPNPFGQRDAAGNPKTDRCLPRLYFEGQPSANLARDVRQGRVSGITLIRAESKASVGGEPAITRQEASLKLGIDHGNLPSDMWAAVKKAILAEASNYPQASIQVVPPGSGRTVSVRVSSDTANPIAELYTKWFDVLKINPPLRHSSEFIIPYFQALLMPILVRERFI